MCARPRDAIKTEKIGCVLVPGFEARALFRLLRFAADQASRLLEAGVEFKRQRSRRPWSVSRPGSEGAAPGAEFGPASQARAELNDQLEIRIVARWVAGRGQGLDLTQQGSNHIHGAQTSLARGSGPGGKVPRVAGFETPLIHSFRELSATDPRRDGAGAASRARSLRPVSSRLRTTW